MRSPLDPQAPLAQLEEHARRHAGTHPESRDLIVRLLDVIAPLTATPPRRTASPATSSPPTTAPTEGSDSPWTD